MTIKVGTRVKVHMDAQDSVLLKYLNTLEGEVVMTYDEGNEETGLYNVLVAYDEDKLPTIQKKAKEHFGTNGHVQLSIVGLARHIGKPKDPRYYLMAFSNEVTPV